MFDAIIIAAVAAAIIIAGMTSGVDIRAANAWNDAVDVTAAATHAPDATAALAIAAAEVMPKLTIIRGNSVITHATAAREDDATHAPDATAASAMADALVTAKPTTIFGNSVVTHENDVTAADLIHAADDNAAW